MSDPVVPGGYIKPRRAPSDPAHDRRDRATHAGRLALFALAVIGGLAGFYVLWLHLTTDPLADARAYFDAAHRLNAGLPLYPPTADTNAAEFYRYPPLLAIILRPFALLPYEYFAILWEAVLAALFVATIKRLGGGRRTWLALGILGIPIGWTLGIAQAQVIVTYLMAVGQPWSIALGGQLKLFPILVAVWWLGRRDWQAVGAVVGWTLILVLAQAFLEPAGSRAFLGIVGPDQVGDVRNISPWAISPILWAVLAATGAVAAVLLAPTRWGWPAAVALATLTSPRLLVYMLMGLLAAVREPDPPAGEGQGAPSGSAPDDAASLVRSAR
ncbi:MAG: DUF2029 domain-containing protein [Chloroflexi bacterium]|nr:DUF2029 domain-containing protein [Chloroflexota bacterium]